MLPSSSVQSRCLTVSLQMAGIRLEGDTAARRTKMIALFKGEDMRWCSAAAVLNLTFSCSVPQPSIPLNKITLR